MIIGDIEQIIELLEKIDSFFMNIEKLEKQLHIDLSNKEAERDDLLHEIELSKLGIGERSKIFTMLTTVLQERREIKDKIELINTIKPYSNKFVSKGICGETKDTIKNIKTLKSNQENRQYTPRILKDLKCAKRPIEKKGE